MGEIMAVPYCGLTVASTFSGCGGSCLGFRWAGFRHVYANEFVPAARETYRANFPDVRLDDRDIRLVQPADVLGDIAPGELDVLEGSPPCASFSSAGKGARGWGEVKAYSDVRQRTDDLFYEFVRLLAGCRPRAFVAENVAGLLRGAAKGYFIRIFEALRGAGYDVRCQVVDAQWLGVPQRRRRTIFVGVRDDLAAAGVRARFPTPLSYRYTITDALSWVNNVRKESGGMEGTRRFDVGSEPIGALRAAGGGAQTMYYVDRKVRITSRRFGSDVTSDLLPSEPAPSLMAYGMNGVARHQDLVSGDQSPEPPVSIEKYAIGAEWAKLRPGESSGRFFNLVRPDAGQPLPTITQAGGTLGAASVTHPSEPRKFTIAELRRLGGFPDDFVLTGSYQQQWERIGRAVPPPMMRAVAEALRDSVFGGGRA